MTGPKIDVVPTSRNRDYGTLNVRPEIAVRVRAEAERRGMHKVGFASQLLEYALDHLVPTTGLFTPDTGD
jgi:hypothetical protein